MYKVSFAFFVLAGALLSLLVFVHHRGEENSDAIVIKTSLGKSAHAAEHTPVTPDGPVSNWAYSEVYEVKEDTMVTGIQVRMEGASTDSLHHLRVLKLGEPSAVCASSTHKDAKEIYTASRNTIRLDGKFPSPYGIPLKKGDKLLVEFMEHTLALPHGPGDSEDIPVLVVTLDTSSERSLPLDFILLRLDDSPCSDPAKHQAFRVPVENEVFTRKSQKDEEGSWYTIPKKGFILERGVNTWPAKGGGTVRAYINGKLADTFTPERGEKDWQWYLPIHHEPIPVAEGDVITIEADYKNPFEQEVVDASGMFGFYFVEDPQ